MCWLLSLLLCAADPLEVLLVVGLMLRFALELRGLAAVVPAVTLLEGPTAPPRDNPEPDAAVAVWKLVAPGPRPGPMRISVVEGGAGGAMVDCWYPL